MTINARRQYVGRAVDQDGNVLDILVQCRRDAKAAKRFFRTLLNRQCSGVWGGDAVGRAPAIEIAEQPVRALAPADPAPRERAMKRFRTPGGAQRFLAVSV